MNSWRNNQNHFYCSVRIGIQCFSYKKKKRTCFASHIVNSLKSFSIGWIEFRIYSTGTTIVVFLRIIKLSMDILLFHGQKNNWAGAILSIPGYLRLTYLKLSLHYIANYNCLYNIKICPTLYCRILFQALKIVDISKIN